MTNRKSNEDLVTPIPWEGVRWVVEHLEEFELTDTVFGRWEGGETAPDGPFILPIWIPSDSMRDFIQGLYDRGLMMNFDWTAWEYGRDLAGDFDRIARSNAQTCLKLLTAHVRSDRFVEGHLAAELKGGGITAILRRLKVLLNSRDVKPHRNKE